MALCLHRAGELIRELPIQAVHGFALSWLFSALKEISVAVVHSAAEVNHDPTPQRTQLRLIGVLRPSFVRLAVFLWLFRQLTNGYNTNIFYSFDRVTI